MFVSLKNKTLIALSLCAISTGAFASDCALRSFDIKIKEQTSPAEIINQLSNVCNFSVVYKDGYSKDKLSALQEGINIKNMHLFDVFDLLVREHGLDYDFANNILRIKGLETRTFKLDYITSIRQGSAVTKANVEVKVGDSSDGGSGSSGSGGDDEDNVIKTKEKFDFWKDIGVEIKRIIQAGNAPDIEPIINANAGLITVTSTPQALKRISNYLAKVEQSLKKQVVIDVAIIEVGLNSSHKSGIDWSKFELGFGGSYGYKGSYGIKRGNDNKDVGYNSAIFTGYDDKGNATYTYNIGPDLSTTWARSFSDEIARSLDLRANINIPVSDMVKFLKESGDVRVISSPKIATLNNQQALITVGDTINYKLKGGTSTSNAGSTTSGDNAQSIFVGILLNILPEISDDNTIMLRINPSISNLKDGENKTPAAGYREIAPDTTQKKLSTVVQARDGETIVLGGLIGDSQGFSKNGVPVLQDIPLLGKLFSSHSKSKRKSELVFIITPHIVDFNKEKTDVKESLKDLGYDLALTYDKPLERNATKSVFSK